MADDIKPHSLRFGDVVLEVTDPLNVQPVSADLYTECRNSNGIICLSFASLTVDGSGPPVAAVTGRIRLSLPGALDLRNALDGLLRETMPAKAQTN